MNAFDVVPVMQQFHDIITNGCVNAIKSGNWVWRRCLQSEDVRRSR